MSFLGLKSIDKQTCKTCLFIETSRKNNKYCLLNANEHRLSKPLLYFLRNNGSYSFTQFFF
jgi:hypothetical protein